MLRNIVPQFQLPELPAEKPAETDCKPESAVPESGLGDDAVSEQPAKDGKVREHSDSENYTIRMCSGFSDSDVKLV